MRSKGLDESHALRSAQSWQEGVPTRSLATLLALTSDAVLAFDGDGQILLANSEAGRLFRAPREGLVGTDVRDLFPPALSPRSEGLAASVPFLMDGTSSTLVCERLQGGSVRLCVRCERIPGPDEFYVLIAFVSEARGAEEQEHNRLVEELSRANKRLAGTLHIVLETLDSLDVGMLFDRVLSEISSTLDAWATFAYVGERDGFRLRAGEEAVGGAFVPTFLASAHPLVSMLSRELRCLRLRVMRPTHEELRGGMLRYRHLIEEESLETILVPSDALFPFASFIICPIWFGGSTIAMLAVGWRHEHGIADDDIRLLEAVSEYLSVQLAGAFAALRAQHSERLKSLGTQLREQLMSHGDLEDELVDKVFGQAADGVEAQCVKVVGNVHQRTTMAKLADGAWRSLPIDLNGLVGPDQTFVLDVSRDEALVQWLIDFGFPSQGVLVVVASSDGIRRGYLLLRPHEVGPFEEVDISFLATLADDVRSVEAGVRARSRDKRISQALQWGMRNVLQHVDGISAQSRYCSATEEAYVGGDFYDLIRLPERRACVIMGDVSGKGVESASVSSAVKTALGAYAWEGVGPARMVSLLNDFLLGFSRVETFATMFVGVIDLAAGKLTYCSAGHPPALLVRSSTGELVSLGVQSGVVGAFGGMSYVDGVTELHEGDVLLLYTDGTTEARSPEGTFFGEEGLHEVAAREVAVGFDGVCERLLAAVEDFAGGTLGDDVALLSLRFDCVG